MGDMTNRSQTDQPLWRRMRFKNNKVWMAVDQNGQPVRQNDKYLIKYQLEQEHEYWVHPANVTPLDAVSTKRPIGGPSGPAAPRMDKSHHDLPHPDEKAVHIYTDGASSGNPGPAGIGVVLEFRGQVREISKYIGHTTNNVAELEAIRTGLLELKKKNLPVVIYTDSSYAHGVLSLGWKARKNREIVDAIRKLLGGLKDVTLVKVRGHAGHLQNERADQLARTAAISSTGGGHR
jgi:ribonuclease HI